MNPKKKAKLIAAGFQVANTPEEFLNLTPVQRLAMEFKLSSHQEDADAILLLDAVFSRICAADPTILTKGAQELQQLMVEAIASWLPPTHQITTK